MSSIFSKIIQREIPAYIVAENESLIAFLDVFPLVRGHVLVVPKIEEDKLFDLPIEILSEMLAFAKPIAKAIEKSFPCKRCGIAVVGLEVPHAHMHVVPLQSADDLNFTRLKLTLRQDELKSDWEAILQALSHLD